MEDLSLRAEFHRALDPIAPPAPWLADAVREAVRARRRARAWRERPRLRFATTPLFRAVVATLLVIVIAITAIGISLVVQLNRQPVVPVVHVPLLHSRPAPTPQLPSATACDGYLTPARRVSVDSRATLAGPYPERMVGATAIWGIGGLFSNDSGAHWRDMSPFSLRRDEPAGLPKTDLPPDFADFYLDSQHAWLARSVNEGVNACYDHVAVFGTADGGNTWTQTIVAGPVQAETQRGYNVQLFFLDAMHGWLRLDPYLYSTVDGGLTWNLVSQSAPLDCEFNFSSPTSGWSGQCDETGSIDAPFLAASRDGGATWSRVQLPVPPGGCGCSARVPHFADQLNGVAYVRAYTGDFAYTTADGGLTWKVLPTLPLQPQYAPAVDFHDPHSLWYAPLPLGWNRGNAWPQDALYRSTDGGHHWSLVQRATPIAYGLCCIPIVLQFFDATHGMLVQPDQNAGGDAPWFWVTSDGGHSWRRVLMTAPQ